METIKNYAKQPSTWRGLVSLAVSAGLISLSSQSQDVVVQAIIGLIATGEGIKGAINVIRNENKKKKK